MKRLHLSNLALLRLVFGAMLLLYSFWLGVRVVHASTAIFSDNFDEPIGTNWQVIMDRQTMTPSKPCMNRTVPAGWIQDQGKLKLVIDGPMCVMDFAPSNLDLRGFAKYQVSFQMTELESSSMDRSFAFLWQDANNWYDVKIFGNSILIQKVVNGVAYQLPNSQKQFPFQVNREYRFSVEVTPEQRILVTIDGQVVLDVAEQGPFIQPTSRQMFALRGSVGAVTRSVVIIDDVSVNAEIATPPTISLNVQLWRQTDPLWSSFEYDHAHAWSMSPNMGRWGCAVTSMAMILRYYGISQLPSGETLNPLTLNAWLNSQVDGYLNGGVNWLAITRLTQLVSSRLNTPKLEFSRADGTLSQIVEFAKQEILANKPVILGYPGHFFVADGIDNTANTLLIKDPYYSFVKLNQHRPPNDANTLRRFQPSHTDLSYILISLPVQTSIQIFDSAGVNIPAEKFSDFIADPSGESNEMSPSFQSVLLPKPDTGEYTLRISQPELKEYQLKIYSYDLAGNVQVQDEAGSVGPESRTITLNYHKEVLDPSPTPTPSPSPTPSPALLPSPSPSPRPSSVPTSPQGIEWRLLQEIRYLQQLILSLQYYRIPFRTLMYQPLFQRLERLKERTNWRNN